MYKRSIIFLVVASVLIVGVSLYLIPSATKIGYTLNAVKLDADSNQISTTQIYIQGSQLDYLFQDSRMDISIAPYDNYSWFKLSEYANAGVEGYIFTVPESEVRYIHLYAWDNTRNDIAYCTLGFSPKLDRFILLDTLGQVCYVASVNDAYTTNELLEYFRALIPLNWSTK